MPGILFGHFEPGLGLGFPGLLPDEEAVIETRGNLVGMESEGLRGLEGPSIDLGRESVYAGRILARILAGRILAGRILAGELFEFGQVLELFLLRRYLFMVETDLFQ